MVLALLLGWIAGAVVGAALVTLVLCPELRFCCLRLLRAAVAERASAELEQGDVRLRRRRPLSLPGAV